MKARENKVLKFLEGSDKRFIIPVYQRPYSWKKEHCVQLMKDLNDVCNYGYNSHFFGSIVFVLQHDGACEEHIIIDGQQRLTTVSLLLLAIKNYLLSDKDASALLSPNKIASYLTDEYADNEKKLKLKLVQGDDEAYSRLLENKIISEDTFIRNNYEYFWEEVNKKTPNEVVTLFEAIKKLDIVTVALELSEGDDPQLIFESMNSTGLDLEESDKIRNYVLMKMEAKNQLKFYKKYWEPLEEEIDREDITRFFRYYLNVKLRKSIAEKNLYKEFKNYKEDHVTLSNEDMLEDILKYSRYFKRIVDPQKDDRCSNALNVIRKLEINTCIPLIMDIFNAEEMSAISSENAQKAIEIIENYIVRREICGLETNQLNKVFVSLGQEVQRDIENDDADYFEAFKREILKKTGKARFPNNHDFRDRFFTYELYNAKSSMRKYILTKLENSDLKERVAVEEQINDGTLTIEHIMPQTLTDEWKQSLGESWELIYTKYLNTPGNLTLTGYNSDYGNATFEKKLNLPKKGFKFSKLSLNEYVKTCDKWGEEEILARAEYLYKLAEKIWWMPQTEYTADESETWVNWDDDYDYAGKNITYISIMGVVSKVENIHDAFIKIHEALYEIDPSAYIAKKRQWFNTKEADLKKPFKIGRNAFIDTSRTPAQKLESVTSIAKSMGLSSGDVMYSVLEDIDLSNEDTYGNVAVGKMAFVMFKDILENDLITEEEIELFKTKEYTKKCFYRSDYPILANSRLDNRGNSRTIRYRKESVTYKGTKVFVTTQWFDENREDVIRWYKEHKKTN